MKYYQKLSVCFMSLIFFVSSLNAQTNLDKPMNTTICKIVIHCGTYDGKIVRFRASVWSDWFEKIALSDPKCDGGIIPLVSQKSLEKPDVQAYYNEVVKGKPGDWDLLITATFTGRLICESNSPKYTGHRIIQIDKVENLEVKRTENPFLKRIPGGSPPPKELFDKQP
jgi:hypothetical protein